jgi:hypothetical protein
MAKKVIKVTCKHCGTVYSPTALLRAIKGNKFSRGRCNGLIPNKAGARCNQPLPAISNVYGRGHNSNL